MTREQAINYLFSCGFTNEQVCDVVRALTYEPTTKNDLGVDCVARQDVERYIEGFINEYTPKEELEFINLELDGLKHIPSVTPQPRKGHWIGHREHCENLGVMPSGLGCYEWCSNCDCGIDVREWHRNNYNFCPNCGADMREVEE